MKLQSLSEKLKCRYEITEQGKVKIASDEINIDLPSKIKKYITIP